MTVYQIACDNCGAKYKLPETFQGKQAKCQKCGSVIEVQKQREAASAAAAAPASKPAPAARPAVDRSKPATAAAPKQAAAAAPKPAARAGRAGKADADDGGRPGRGERETKKDNTMPVLLAGLGLLAVAGGLFFLTQGGDAKPAEPAKAGPVQAQAAPAAPAPAATPAASTPAAAPAAPTPAAPAKSEPAASEPAASEPAKAEPAKAEPPAAAATPAVPEDPTRPKKPWERMRNAPASIAEVADPKSYGDVPWPPGIDDAAKGKLRELAAEAAGDGIRSTRAKNELQKAGWPAIFALVEQLQKLDYKQAEPSMVGFDLNKLLETITGGVNLRYEPVDAGESIPAAKAEWNTRTVKGWIEFAGRSVDQEAYDKARAERLKKAGGADK
jgi:hypothetical protein